MNRLRQVFVIIVVILLVMFLFSTQYKQYDNKSDIKHILYWMPMFQELDFYLGLGSHIFENCTYKNCYATHDKNFLPIDKYDAILFHGVEYKKQYYSEPNYRSPRQVYIFSNQESPMYTPLDIQDFKNFYNWTMTYRIDSDIPRPYGYLQEKQSEHKLPSQEEIQKRPKKIAWFVSNCATASQREDLVMKLKKYIPVDVYGRCGNLTCPRNISEKCYEMISANYKFYLSFENSVCDDYVTEKLYNILKYNIVPIVYGGADYDKIAPPHSVINVMKFKSIRKLVQYLKYLDNHASAYLKYFEWKKNYKVSTNNDVTLCTLCKKLNQPITPKIYSDIATWWRGPDLDKCHNRFLSKFL